MLTGVEEAVEEKKRPWNEITLRQKKSFKVEYVDDRKFGDVWSGRQCLRG